MTMLGPSSFLLFARLPKELRLLVWEQYALPRVPVYYTCFSRYTPLYPVLYQSNSTVRCLMQVSREARSTVLGNRQLYYLQYGRPPVRSRQHALFYENFPTAGEKRERNWTEGYMFVDFEKDIFCFEFIRSIEFRWPKLRGWPIIKEHIKNMTFDLSYAISILVPQSVLRDVSFYLESASRALIKDFYPHLGPDLKSLRRLQLIFSLEHIQRLYSQDCYEDSDTESTSISRPRDIGILYIPISAKQLAPLILERNPARVESAENWRRNVLSYETSRFAREVSTMVSKLCERDVRVDITIKNYSLSLAYDSEAPK
ncbi:hypothetical protein F5Y00DRAFT_59811 [Daldinia vernicosa]|uniref:uncharacterized protein n=1 Tax=Daldinia vernicosa TaxID=114800 RepID=UPI0020075BD5|nr:uncharacterized protein F5Y00DRAFT_59811 [Daldinia vernicosa]KAI0853786.1 hypothetical protein F5Y00DRAFT_59811 [Daldinia vernicosa]